MDTRPPTGTARTRPLRVFVVDDHPVVWVGMTLILSESAGCAVVGFAGGAAQALRDLEQQPVDLVLVDYDLGSATHGAELCQALTAPPYGLMCLGMAEHCDVAVTRAFLAAGASGVFLKDQPGEEVVGAVQAVSAGRPYLDPRLMDPWGPQPGAGECPQLSATEQKVLWRLAQGSSNKEIAGWLGVSPSSVKGYVSHVLHKLGVRSRAEAVAVAARTGLLALAPEHSGRP